MNERERRYISEKTGKDISEKADHRTNRKMRVAFHTLGCKVNAYETEAMRQELVKEGFDIMEFIPGADIYIINTCTVTNIADRKSRQMLHRAKKLNPNALVIAAGCYVQTRETELLQDTCVDIVIGTNRKSEICDIIKEYLKENSSKGIPSDIRSEILSTGKKSYLTDVLHFCEYDNMQISADAEHTRAFVKIQDGCNQFCSYCIIPYARGRIRSRELADIREEAEKLAKNGYQELVLTGIHLSSYGQDKENLTLLDAINTVSQIEKIQRVRLGSIEQGIISETFVRALAENKKFCPHFHLSLQSGSKEVLKRMNRHYTPEEYLEKCSLIRSFFDRPALTTDVITGFPGETEKEFLETEEFLKKAAFSQMHIFKYSMRQGTVAAKMENQISDAVKAERSSRLINLNEKLEQQYREQFLGTVGKILIEEETVIEGIRCFTGYTSEYVRAAVVSDSNLVNKMAEVNFKKLLNAEILLAELVKIY